MKKFLLLTSLMTILCLLASGCSRYVRQAVKIQNPDTAHETIAIDVAVDLFGVKHIVTRVCSISVPSDCEIVYSTATTGTPTVITTLSSPTGYIGMEHPAIAVTDNGVAAIAWDTSRTAGGSGATLYVLSTALGSINEIDMDYVAGTPHLVSKGNKIYAVQGVLKGSDSGIRYRQLVGGSSSGWVIKDGISLFNNYVDSAVSPSGHLFVVFWRLWSYDIMYADNYATAGDMTNVFGLISGASAYTDPRIDVNGSPEVVYVTYTHEFDPGPGFSDLLVIGRCLAASCSFGTYQIVLPLDPSKAWDINGVTDIIADSVNTAYYVFSASNSDSGANYDIFEGYFQDGLPNFYGNITNTPGSNDGTPSIGLMWSIIPVTGWVTEHDIYQFDTYPFPLPPPFYPYASLRQIYHTENTILADVDMACNADWGAGVWIEDQATQQSYLIFNTYPSMLPMIKK